MNLAWERWKGRAKAEARRPGRRPWLTAAVIVGAVLLVLPLVPSLRRYANMESM